MELARARSPSLTKCDRLGHVEKSSSDLGDNIVATSSILHLSHSPPFKSHAKLIPHHNARPQEPRPLCAAVRRPLLHQSHPPSVLPSPTSSSVIMVAVYAAPHGLLPHLGRTETRIRWYDSALDNLERRLTPPQSRRSSSQNSRMRSPWRTT